MKEFYPDADELYDVVDDAGRVIGQATRAEVHADRNLIHRAVHVLIFRPDGRLIMQLRAQSKDVEPGKWDTSVGGHLNAGEDWMTAARRETQEEMRLSGVPLEFLYEHQYRSPRESEDIRTYRAIYAGPVHPQALEISAARDWTPEEISARRGRGVFTRSFEEEWRLYQDFLLQGGGSG